MNLVGQKTARHHIDANGNLTNDGNGKTYAYDAANRMISVTQGSNVTGFVYDGYGQRVQETLNGTVIKQWVWVLGSDQPDEERDGSNNVTKRFYDLGEQINGVNYYVTKDHQASIREMTNAAGALVARYDYDPYGRRTLVSGTDLADFGFTGFYYDQATSLDFSMSRPYDPNLGRWLSRDPVGENGGINLYAYCHGDPINYRDPTGHVAIPIPTNPEQAAIEAAIALALAIAIYWALHHHITIPNTPSECHKCKQQCYQLYQEHCSSYCANLPTKAQRRQCYIDALNVYNICTGNCEKEFGK